jgi:hypothetical protein
MHQLIELELIIVRLGAFAISFGLPIACYAATLLCNDISGCPVPSALSPSTLTIETLKQEVGWPANGIWGLASWDVSAKVLGYYLLSLILHRVLPGEQVEGTLLSTGGKLKYKFNSTLEHSNFRPMLIMSSVVINNDHPRHLRSRYRRPGR